MREIADRIIINRIGTILLVLMLMTWTSFAWGASSSPEGTATVTGTIVNIRSTPAVSGEIITRVAKGDKLTILANKNEWYQVKTKSGQTGWIAGYLVELDKPPVEKKVDTTQPSTKQVLIKVDGKLVDFDIPPYIDAQDRTMVPIRFVATELGSQVFWNGEEGLVTITNKGQIIQLWIGQAVAMVNNEDIPLDTTPVLQDGRTMVPLRFVGDSLGVKVDWDGGANTVVLTTKKPETPSLGQDSNTKKTALVTGSIVNMRTGPGTDYPAVAQIKKGELLTILGESDDWYRIQSREGHEGWVANWLVAVRTDANAPSRSPEPGERERPLPPVYTGPNSLTNIYTENFGDSLEIIIEGEFPLNYSYMSLNNPLRIVFDFHNTSLDLDWDEDQMLLTDNRLAAAIRVGQFSQSQGRIVIDLKDIASLQTSTNDDGSKLFIKLQPPSIKGKVIVLDPGHGTIQPGGWADPGAIGPSGLYERDVTTDISWKLYEILTREGATVIMTRTGNTTNLDLVGRAQIANENKADIFVSVHVNSSTKSSVAGTSTYYYAPGNSALGGQRNTRQRLASLVQQELVSYLGRRNIGILEANFVVLRETKMPSILVETAFLSNPEEERLLATEAFRAKAAEGIAKGIIRYFAE